MVGLSTHVTDPFSSWINRTQCCPLVEFSLSTLKILHALYSKVYACYACALLYQWYACITKYLPTILLSTVSDSLLWPKMGDFISFIYISSATYCELKLFHSPYFKTYSFVS